MSKDMDNNQIRAYEGGDYAKLEDNYNPHQLLVSAVNRLGKIRRSNG